MQGADATGGHERVAVITVNWNSWQKTLECYESLVESGGSSWHLYIVENGSVDGSDEHLKFADRRVTVISSQENLGWTGGNNIGLAQALSKEHQYIFILNNDAKVIENTIDVLVELSERLLDSGVQPVLGPVHRGAKSSDYDFVGAKTDPQTGIPGWMDEGQQAGGESYPTSYISGAGIFCSADCFRKVGLFNDRFFLNFDDADWAFRAQAQGFSLLMVSTSTILHEGSFSIGGRSSPLQTYFMTRNRLLFSEYHCTAAERIRLWVWSLRSYKYMINEERARGQSISASIGSARSRAFLMGVRDYVLRRFGDCPSIIRSLNMAPDQRREASALGEAAV